MLTAHVGKDKQASEQVRQKQGVIPELWQAIRSDKAINATRLLWSKVPDGWHKNPYVWTGIVCTLVFFALFIFQICGLRSKARHIKAISSFVDKASSSPMW